MSVSVAPCDVSSDSSTANCQRSARLSSAYCDAFKSSDKADRKLVSINAEGSYMRPLCRCSAMRTPPDCRRAGRAMSAGRVMEPVCLRDATLEALAYKTPSTGRIGKPLAIAGDIRVSPPEGGSAL